MLQSVAQFAAICNAARVGGLRFDANQFNLIGLRRLDRGACRFCPQRRIGRCN
jgi:hypothetical protein